MIVILNISSEKFSLNGIPYFKNFMPHVLAGKLKIVNVYDSTFQLTALDSYSNYSVDGVIHPNITALQDALLPVLYTRNSLNFDSTLPFYNQITKQTGIESSGLDKTFNAGWEWLINNVQYSNVAAQTISFPLASAGKQRLDRVVVTNLNTFVRIPGPESVSSPSADARPDNTVDVTFVLVTDSEVGEPSTPIVGDEFITKVSKGFIRMFYTGHVDSVPVDDRSYLKFEEGMLSLKSIQIADSGFLYHGRDFVFKNGTSGNVTLYHMQGTGNFRFNFPNSQDFVIKPEESIHFVMRAINVSNNGGLLDPVGLGIFKEELSNKKTTIVGNEASDIFYGTIKSWITYLKDTWLSSLATKVTITDTTMFPVEDEADSNKAKVVSWLNIKNTIKTFLDALFQVKDNQVEISANSNVLNAWHGQTVLFTANCTITVPASLNSSLMFPFRTLPGVTVTWAITSPHVWETTPAATPEKTVGHFMKRGSTNTIMLDV